MTVDADKLKRTDRADPEPEWLTVMEVCREYNISRQTVYDLCQKGNLPYYTIPSGRRRFRRAEIEPVLAPYRTPITNPRSRVKDPLGGLAGPVTLRDDDAEVA